MSKYTEGTYIKIEVKSKTIFDKIYKRVHGYIIDMEVTDSMFFISDEDFYKCVVTDSGFDLDTEECVHELISLEGFAQGVIFNCNIGNTYLIVRDN